MSSLLQYQLCSVYAKTVKAFSEKMEKLWTALNLLKTRLTAL